MANALEDKVRNDLARYNSSARNYYWAHHVLSAVVLIAGVFVAALATRAPTPTDALFALGLVVAIAQVLVSLFKTNENWLRYRNAAERLRNNLDWYDARIGEYDVPADQANDLLGRRWKRVREDEVAAWGAARGSKDPE